jgi:hypothetical protein
MTGEELDRERAFEARRICHGSLDDLMAEAARLAREGWTPPDPLEDALDELMAWWKHTGENTLPSHLARKALERGIAIGRGETAAGGVK